MASIMDDGHPPHQHFIYILSYCYHVLLAAMMGVGVVVVSQETNNRIETIVASEEEVARCLYKSCRMKGCRWI